MWISTITNAGENLISRTFAGQSIMITSVKAGTGTVNAAKLMQQTGIVLEKQVLNIEFTKSSENNVRTIGVLLDNLELQSGYILQQIGFYADDPDNGTILFAIAQNETGKEIPSKTEMPMYSVSFDFSFVFNPDIGMQAVIDPSGFVTENQLENLSIEIKNTYQPKGNYLTEHQDISGKADKYKLFNITVNASNWTSEEAPYTNTLSINMVTCNSDIQVMPADTITVDQAEAWASAMIMAATQSTDSITLKAFGDKPEIDIPITVLVGSDVEGGDTDAC